jgi:CubicO group peptidase (beta-lactamase class C family)
VKQHRGASFIALLTLASACAPGRPAAPQPSGWAGVTRLLDSVIASGDAPGAVLGVSYRGRHYFYGTGRLGQDDATTPDSATVYDLASLTKAVSLTTLAMQAVDEGLLDLDAPVVSYLPAFGGAIGEDGTSNRPAAVPPWRRAVTIHHLLTHSSGLPAWRPLYQEASSRTEALALADSTILTATPGATYVYSDLGAIVLTQVIEQLLSGRIDTLFSERVATPLGLEETRYLPPTSWRKRIAPTENDPWRGRLLQGEVHDENAARLDGVSGHAGLFGSARDLVRFAEWLLEEEKEESGAPGGGKVDGPSPASRLPSALIRRFTTPQDLPPGSSRGLGWDTPSEGSSAGHHLGSGSFGHTGFTGTSIWIDPSRRLAIILLSNRVHPVRSNQRWGRVRALVADRVVTLLAPKPVTR